jgi:GAF domain-containing protein
VSDDELKRLLEDFLLEDAAAARPRGDSAAGKDSAGEYVAPDQDVPGKVVLPERQLLQVPEGPEAQVVEGDRLVASPATLSLRRITAAQDVDQVLAAVLEYAHHLDLDRCLIALLEDTRAPAAQRWVEVRAVWDRAGEEDAFLGNRFSPVEIPLVGAIGLDDQVVVNDFATSQRVDEQTRATFQYLGVGAAAILPLAVGGRLLGWLLAETVGRARSFARQEVAALQSIADQAAVAVANLGLLKETRARAIQLQAAAEISSAASSLLDVDELLTLAVELIRERFELYYVGIFLLQGDPSEQEPSPAAVLRAGTGQAGQQMMAEGYRLAIGDRGAEQSSMIGWCVANSRARIALDVGQDAVHFDNPLLPETRSEMALPLNSRGRVVGAMTIQSSLPAAFDESDVAVLQIMADQLANAIENARLFQERERRITELAIVNEIGASLSSLTLDALSLDALFEIVHRQVSRLFDADNFYIATYEEGSEWWMSAFHLEQGERQPEARYSIATGLTGHIIRTRQPLRFSTLEENHRFQEAQGVQILGNLAHSWLGVPLVASEKLVGVMAIQDYAHEHLYGEADVALFATVGAQVAGALDNVHLLEEARRRAGETELINQVGQTIASVLDLDEVLRQIVDVTKERFGHYFVSISLLEGERLIFRQGSTIGDSDRRLGQSVSDRGDEKAGADVLTVDLTRADSLIGDAVRSRQPVLVGDVLLDPRYLAIEELPDTRSELAVPIEVKGRVIGTLDVQSDRPYAYDQTDLVLVQSLARQAGVAIENAQLFGETRRQAEEFAVLHRSSLEMTQEQLELDAVLATASRRLMELLNSDGGGVWLWQEADRELELVLTYQVGDLAEAYEGRRLEPGEGLAGRAFAQKQIQAVDDYLAWNGMSSTFDDAPFAAALAVPMMWRGQAVGVLVATRSQPGRPFLPGEQNLAELLASQAAAAIQNARLLGDAQSRAEQLAVANEVGQTVISVLDVDAVLRQIVDTIKERLGYFFVGILLLEGEHLVFRSGSLIGDSDTR